jgi:hypothetical protein
MTKAASPAHCAVVRMRSKEIGVFLRAISMVRRWDVAPESGSVRSSVSSTTVAVSAVMVSTPTSSVPASRAAATRVSTSERNSSKITFCNPIGRARRRLSQRWIGGSSS